jgi:hypothetical protein
MPHELVRGNAADSFHGKRKRRVLEGRQVPHIAKNPQEVARFIRVEPLIKTPGRRSAVTQFRGRRHNFGRFRRIRDQFYITGHDTPRFAVRKHRFIVTGPKDKYYNSLRDVTPEPVSIASSGSIGAS